MLRVGIIGYGYWGPNLLRNFMENENCEVKACCDLQPERGEKAKTRCPAVDILTNDDDFFARDDIDAVAIATPVSTHSLLAKKALSSGKHVLLEKPMTATAAEAEELIELARKKNLTLMVDHIFVYTPAVRKIKEIIDSGELGDLYYFDSVRVNLGLFQHDINVLWDLAPHDLSILDYIIGKGPMHVSAEGVDHFGTSIENIVYLTTYYEDNFIGHVHVNWLAPVKIRMTIIGGSKKMIVYNDNEPSEKVKVYDKGVEVTGGQEGMYKMLVQYRTGDMYAPKLGSTEALKTAVQHFIECISEGKAPITDGHAGLRVVKILEAAQKQISTR